MAHVGHTGTYRRPPSIQMPILVDLPNHVGKIEADASQPATRTNRASCFSQHGVLATW